MSVQQVRNRPDTSLIGFDQLADAVSNARTEAQTPGSDTHASHQAGQPRNTFRKRRRRERVAIDPGAVAARLNRLFDTIRPPGRGPLRNYEVIKALHARGIEISAPYLSQLRAGRRSHPSLETLRHLAEAFGVSVAYFTDTNSAYTRYLEAELCWLEMAHDPHVRQMTTALLTLPPDVREGILQTAEFPPEGSPACQ